MDKTAFFKLTYGLFLAGVEYEGKWNACIINTAAQATSDPFQMIATMQKSNYTTELILKKKSLAISVFSIKTPLDVITNFGYSSGRDRDKFETIAFRLDEKKNPYLADHTVAVMNCDVTQTLDLGTHYLFICTVRDAVSTSDDAPMTYTDYRTLKSGGSIEASKESTEGKTKKQRYVCSVCHYVYDGEIPFEELPDDYVCPVCGAPKSEFVAEEYYE
jgi:flavin reductase (DIM6/NTAB) family NADH-FMN oxidoreductase RutF